MLNAIFTEDGRKERCTGYTTVAYSSDNDEILIETNTKILASVFEDAKANSETLDGPDESIDAAIDDPLAFRDFLILDSDGAITFDSDYARSKPDETQA